MSDRPSQTSKEKMAIPEGGGEDHMDVSYQEEGQISGYVSIKSKGPGRPIHLRLNGKSQNLSQGVEANSARSVSSYVYNQRLFKQAYPLESFRDESEDFLDKKTGHAVSLESISNGNASLPEDNSNGAYIENNYRRTEQDDSQIVYSKFKKQSGENEQKSTQADSGFRSQAKVFSLSSNVRNRQAHVSDSPGKKKYKLHQAGAKKRIGTKNKAGHGKEDTGLPLVARGQPYPKWMNIPLSEIFSGQGCVNIDGKKHRVEISLVPVDDIADDLQNFTVPEEKRGPGIDPAVTGDIHANGSIDRPPDTHSCFDNNNGQNSSVFPGTETQVLSKIDNNTNNTFCWRDCTQTVTGSVSAPGNYGNTSNQPLDLTVVKPLDLSVKKTISINDTWQGQKFIPGRVNEVPYGMNRTSVDVRAESNLNHYRARCPSSLSVDDRDSITGEESFDPRLASDLSLHCSEEVSNSDGNLPSLSKLTLESTPQEQATVSPSSGVQDSAGQQEMARFTRGQKEILDLVSSGKVSFKQLAELYLHNQQMKQANSLPHSSTSATEEIYQLTAETRPSKPQSDDSSIEEFPAPAMPNLQSLELADSEGGLYEKEEERTKHRLKAMIQRKNQK